MLYFNCTKYLSYSSHVFHHFCLVGGGDMARTYYLHTALRRSLWIAGAVATFVAVAIIASCSSQQATDGPQQQQDPTGGLVGTWVSSGDNVAPLLRNLLMTDSILATFNADGSYRVTEFRRGGTNFAYSGSYTYTRSDKDTLGSRIFTIEVRQAMPSVATARGIYHVQTSVSPARLLYEVIQTEPPAGIAPTVAGGFGSSRNVMGVQLTGNFSNIQVFRKR